MENISEKLIENLTKLTELEINNLQIKSEIFIRKLNEKLETSLKEIELRIDEEIVFFNQNPKKYIQYKESTIKGYEEQLQKIYDEYKIQYINICEELQEIQINQKIAIANIKKIQDLKKEFIKSEKYEQYKALKYKYKKDMDNSENKEDFEKYMNLLKNLNNPIEEYDNKINEMLNKAKEYELINSICIEKINECINNSINDLNKWVQQKTNQLQVYNQSNIFKEFYTIITNFFLGKKRLQINVIDTTEYELECLEQEVSIAKKNIKNNTIKFIKQLLDLKDEAINKTNA